MLREKINSINCPVCNSTRISSFLRRRQVPVQQNLLLRSQEAAITIERGDLDLVMCRNCGFVFNRAFNADLLSYGEHYDNTQLCSPIFRTYVEDLIKHLINERGVVNKNIVDVGCGKGLFLKSLCESGDNTGIGFDPSYVGPSAIINGKVRFKGIFYGPDSGSIQADVVVCRHVIEHVPDPLSLLRSVRQALENSPSAQVFFETPCLEWTLQNKVNWDFFYEHCSYFTKQSLTTAFEITGFRVEHVWHVFKGQYLWLEAKLAKGHNYNFNTSPGQFILAKQLAANEVALIHQWQKRLKELCSLGHVAIWGAGAKGVTFANLIDPNCKWINCIVDLNPDKQGGYIPGTGHPIVSYYDLPKRNVAIAILMNPNYRKENETLLKEAGIQLNLIEHDNKPGEG